LVLIVADIPTGWILTGGERHSEVELREESIVADGLSRATRDLVPLISSQTRLLGDGRILLGTMDRGLTGTFRHSAMGLTAGSFCSTGGSGGD
jgi:hypothetical protein